MSDELTLEFEASSPVASLADRFVVVDLETNPDTSDPRDHEIIEIGAILVERWKPVQQFNTLVRNGRPLVAAARELTGLSDDHLTLAPRLADALRDLAVFVGDLPLVAYNGIAYDFRVLDGACERMGIPIIGDMRLDLLDLVHLLFPRRG